MDQLFLKVCALPYILGFNSQNNTGIKFVNACPLFANIPCWKIKLASLKKKLFNHVFTCIMYVNSMGRKTTTCCTRASGFI